MYVPPPTVHLRAHPSLTGTAGPGRTGKISGKWRPVGLVSICPQWDLYISLETHLRSLHVLPGLGLWENIYFYLKNSFRHCFENERSSLYKLQPNNTKTSREVWERLGDHDRLRKAPDTDSSGLPEGDTDSESAKSCAFCFCNKYCPPPRAYLLPPHTRSPCVLYS